jgi:hypothetical protein
MMVGTRSKLLRYLRKRDPERIAISSAWAPP